MPEEFSLTIRSVDGSKNGRLLPLPKCPHCGISKPYMPLWFERQHDANCWWAVFGCSNCGNPTTVKYVALNNSVIKKFPSAKAIPSDLPARAAEFLQQAIDSLQTPAGSVMLSSNAVDAMMQALGYGERSRLVDRIQKASQDGKITKEMADWAHEVRLEANLVRHDHGEDPLPTQDDASRLIEFAYALGEFLFSLPARVIRGRAKKNSNATNLGAQLG